MKRNSLMLVFVPVTEAFIGFGDFVKCCIDAPGEVTSR